MGDMGVRSKGDLGARLATGAVGTARASLGLAARASMSTAVMLDYWKRAVLFDCDERNKIFFL